MKFVLIPDSFKGTLSSAQICGIMESRIRKHFPDSTIVSVPVADGGEGTVDAFLAAVGGKKRFITVKNPYFEDIKAGYGLIEDGRTAVMEMAACAGLPLVEERKNPLLTTTYGAGEMILDAAGQGVRKIILGLGGSCTNDGGCGAGAAAGGKFFSKNGKEFIPTGGTVGEIASIDLKSRWPGLAGIEIITMCDIENPMYGPNGASFIFGPQKGADMETAAFLDQGIRHLSEAIKESLGQDLSQVPGSGAAGAMGAGMLAFFGARLQMGIDTVLNVTDFDRLIEDADYIFTGEGKLDGQSLGGKVVIGVARKARTRNKPVIAVVGGAVDEEIENVYKEGVSAVFSINRLPQDFSVSRSCSRENLEATTDNILRLIKLGQQNCLSANCRK